MKKIILATCSYVLLSMAIAYPWHMIVFHDVYLEIGAFTRAEPMVAFGMLAMIIQGVVIAYLYPFYYHGGHPVATGIRFSLIIGLMVYTVMVFATVAKFEINPVSTFLVYSTIFQIIQFVVTGTALGLIYGRNVNHHH